MQVTVYHDGALIVDAVSGYTAADEAVKVTAETLFPVFSVSKGVTSTLIHRLIQQGFFGLDQTIASVWPEFGAHGKESITLRHVLTHTAGLARLPGGLMPEQVADWEGMCRVIEQMTPRHTPGAEAEYHALSMGWLLGGVAERATGKKYAELLKQEICAPLGLENLFIGLPPSVQNPVAVVANCEVEGGIDPTTPQAVPAALWPLTELMNQPFVQRACLPAANGLMAAGDIARHYAATLPGGVDGIEFFTATQRAAALDPLAGLPGGEWLCGYARKDGLKSGPVRSYGHNGHGGSKGGADLDRRVAYGVTHNAFSPVTIVDDVLALILDRVA